MDVAFKGQIKKENRVLTKLKKFFTNYGSDFYFFLFLVIIGVAFFADSLFFNQFTTLFGGDYTSQQLSFYTNGYDDWWHFLTTGEFVLFDSNTYLGTSNLGSNSFYYLFDPFFLPILIWPREFIAQGMAFLTIFKIAAAGTVFSHYMMYMGASKKASRISALAYAFSGWMAWFLWFNHMTEITIVFPMMLWGVEKVLREKRPWLLMSSTFLMGLTNYFFLIGMTIAAFLYAIFRFFQRYSKQDFKENMKILGIGFIGFFAGLLLTCCVVLPSAIVALEAPRAANSGYLDCLKQSLIDKDFNQFFSYIFEWRNISFSYEKTTEFRHFYPIINFFFPCASCRGTPITRYGNETYDNVATNIYSFVPMMIFFFPAIVKAVKEKKFSVLIALILFIYAVETPFCYYMFFGFTAPYGRWELFVVTSYITFCGLYIDKAKDEPFWTMIVSGVISIGMTIASCFLAKYMIDSIEKFTPRNKDIPIEILTLIMCLYEAGVCASMVVLRKKKFFNTLITAFIVVEAVVMGFLTIEGHSVGSFINANNGLSANNDLYSLTSRIQSDDPGYYRCWSYLQNESGRNDGMRNNYNGLGCFHSLYNFNLNNFLLWSQIQDGNTFAGSGSWAGSYVWKNNDLDRFLGIKYYFVHGGSPQWAWMRGNGGESDHSKFYQYNVPFDFEEITSDYKNGTFTVFKDSKFVNFGYSTNTIIPAELAENSKQYLTTDSTYGIPWTSADSGLKNDYMLLEGAIMEHSIAEEYLTNNANLQEKAPSFIRNEFKDYKHQLSYSSITYDVQKCLSDADYGFVKNGYYTCRTFWDSKDNNGNVITYALTSDQLLNLSDTYFPTITTDKTGVSGRYVTVITPNIPISDPQGVAYYVNYPYTSSTNNAYDADIYFVDENNNIITWDRHQDDKYNNSYRKYRGFYIKGDHTITKIIICNRNKSSLIRPTIYYEKYNDYASRTAKLYEGVVENVNYSTNHFDFTTNFSEKRFVVTQVPYDKGWTLTATNNGQTKNIDVVDVQGGFVGFLSEAGETTYSLNFYTQYLKEGKMLTCAGLFIFITTFAAQMYYDFEIKKRKYMTADLQWK